MVGPWSPPQGAFATRLVELQSAVGKGETRVQSYLTPCDNWPNAFVDLAIVLVLIKAAIQKRSQKITSLRNTATNHPRTLLRHWIRSTDIITVRILEE